MRKGYLLVILVLLTGCGEITYMVGPVDWSNLPSTPPPGQKDASSSPKPTQVNIARKSIRIYHGDASIGWDSTAQYQAEWRGACGPTAMTVVLRAGGIQTGVGTTLDRLRAADAYDNGITKLENYASIPPVYYAGLDSTYYYHLTDQHLEQMTDAGYAVLTDIWDPDGRYYQFQVGHWLTVIGHDPVKGRSEERR